MTALNVFNEKVAFQKFTPLGKEKFESKNC